MVTIRRLTAQEALESVDDLAAVLVDCVEGGASVSFLAPFRSTEAREFYRKVAEGVAKGDRILLAAFATDESKPDKLIGTVQVLFPVAPNQPHRGDVAKLLVYRSARGQGVGRALMLEVERACLREGRTVLVLDTATGDAAERLYERLGWTRLGVVPRYALYPDGRFCDSTFFWKQLQPV